MEQHLNVLYSAQEVTARFVKQAEQYRLVKEAKKAQAASKPSLKQLLGLQLVAFGHKLAQDTQPAYVE